MRECSLAVEGTSVVAETYAFVDVSKETAARPLKLKRLRVLVCMQRWLRF